MFADVDNHPDNHYLQSTLDREPTKTKEEALVELYKRLRPGDPPTRENASSLLKNLFFDSRRYDLARVGRYKLNKRLELDPTNDTRVLTPEDLVAIIKKMVRVDLRTIVLDVPKQDVISRDNFSVKVNAVVYFRIVDPSKAIIQVVNPYEATSQLVDHHAGELMARPQQDLFAAYPPGMRFREEFVTAAEERALLEHAAALPFPPFQFHGWTGNRETVPFGWRYDFSKARVESAPPIPEFLLPLRARAAQFAGLDAAAFEQALVIRYDVGAGIGWGMGEALLRPMLGTVRRIVGAVLLLVGIVVGLVTKGWL
jgi:hypothetical protein